jgi:hypothetical protein
VKKYKKLDHFSFLILIKKNDVAAVIFLKISAFLNDAIENGKNKINGREIYQVRIRNKSITE